MLPTRFVLLAKIAAFSTAAFFSGAAHGAILTVGKPNTNCPNPQYTTIAEAVSAALPGDEIAICPALYAEQVVITKPLTLRGIAVNGIHRVLLQPPVKRLEGLPFAAVISVVNTNDVSIEDLAIDASNNQVKGCSDLLAGIGFYNSSGIVRRNAIFGAQLKDPQSCTALFPGTGFGVHIDSDRTGRIRVLLENNSIRDFTRNGILATGSGVSAEITGNSIAGAGPQSGSFQFGVFIANGAVARVTKNRISQANCGAVSYDNCWELRSEGVVLRNAGEGTIIDGNTINNTQSGIFINGARNARITGNIIHNTDLMSAIHVQGMTSGLIAENRIYGVGPISGDASVNLEGCGINVISGLGSSGNVIADNYVTDAYCGLAYVSADLVVSGTYVNTLYSTFNSDMYLEAYPPAVQPPATVN